MVKRISRIFSILLLSGFAVCSASGCFGSVGETESAPDGTVSVAENSLSSDSEETVVEKAIEPLSFIGIEEAENLQTFISEVDNQDGSHDNTAKQVGTILSPYFELKAEGKKTECYAVRTTFGAHSFALLDVSAESFPLKAEIDLLYGAESIVVLPEKYGVTAEVSFAGVVQAEIPGFGNYTFVADGKKETALTVFVREKEEFSAPEGYDVVRVSAGNHAKKLSFTKEKQVLFFEKGNHYLKYNIEFFDNTEVYLEAGCYIYATMPDRAETPMLDPAWSGKVRWNALFHGKEVQNIGISGRGMIDLSMLDWHARSAINFESCKDVKVEGVTLNNSPEWTLYAMYSERIEVKDILLFGYRQNSDGICFGDCRDVLTENCFARSGDDLFEVKSMNGNCTIPIENIRFVKCNAWPDKARGFGIIYESVRDITDVRFEDCSVGFASAIWQDELGALVVIMGGQAKVTDIHFEDIEIYSSALYPINVTVYKDSSANVESVYFKNIDIRGVKSVRVANNSTAGGKIGTLYFDGCMRDGALIKTYAKLGLSLTNVEKISVLINRCGE